nr:ammonia-forming cytochrome c nitrite reductase subunit c552 [Desulforamulus aquiferis]
MKTLFAGYGFGEEYFEERGHFYALEDNEKIAPARRKAGAVCLYCKSSEVPGLLAKYGDQFGDLTYDEGRSQVTHSIGCTDCHNPETMALRITRPALEDALTRRGQDWKLASRQEMRSLVCAQCHVEYYFTSDPRKVTFPWDKGFTAEQMEEYYGSYEQPVHVDWEHPQSGTKLLKAQHPEYEFSQGGTHNAAGVSCADCHMPYMREGNTKVTSHWWVSPTRTIQQSCTQCHRESEQWLLDRVHYIQDRQFEALRRAGNLNVQVIQEIEKSSQESTVDAALLEEARALHRSSQWRWDYMSAENSMGFHNSQEGLRTLNQAIDLAHRAIDTARRHGGFNNAKNKTKSFGTMEVANLHVPGYYTAAAGHCFCHCRHLQPTGICFTLVFVIKRVANPKYCLHYWCENPSINR